MDKNIEKLKSSFNWIKRYLPIVLHYGHSVVISVGTAIFGAFLITYSADNVIERVVLFPDGLSVYVGMVAILLGLIKIFAVFQPNNKVKKWSLICIALLWLIISWSYVVDSAQNMGIIMAPIITASCYVELWRGDYRDD